MERSSSRPGFQSRRSYPSFNQLSLTPLTPRYHTDDDDSPDGESQGYYSARSESPERPISEDDYSHTPRPASYLTSMSVPGTPGVLSQSQSRSTSRTRTRHGRSKSSSRMHQDGTSTPRRSSASRNSVSSDSEWMLRTGIMLASSTREEKGQSWLVKRASSTSLASDAANNNYYENHAAATATAASSSSRPRSSNSKAASHKSRSGMSTPSRPGSRCSRRGNKPDLTTSGLEMTSSYNWVPTPTGENTNRESIPDIVDERIQAEMTNMQQDADADADVDVDDGASSSFSSASDVSSNSEDDIDEKEMQRLTRERGFGLGSWLDRMVEWTFFGVDEWPTLFPAGPGNRDPPAPDSGRVVEDAQAAPEQADDKYLEDDTDVTTIFDTDDETFTPMVEKPGEVGGWEDARWFFKTIKQALL